MNVTCSCILLAHTSTPVQDVVSIRGRTYYPPEIEAVVERQLARTIKPGCSAAFVCEVRQSGQVVYEQALVGQSLAT